MATDHADGRSRKPKRLSGLSKVRTAVKSRVRSKPMAEGQECLDMYVLTRERGRWGRLAQQCAGALEEIDDDLRKLRTTLPDIVTGQGEDDAPERDRKRRGKDLGMFAVE